MPGSLLLTPPECPSLRLEMLGGRGRVRRLRVIAEKRNDPRDKPKDRFCLTVFSVSNRQLVHPELRCHFHLGEAEEQPALAEVHA